VYKIALGIGVNIPPHQERLYAAISLVSEHIAVNHTLTCSNLYETEALLPAGAPKEWNINYLNCVIVLHTRLEPRNLLHALKLCESKSGRLHDAPRWCPRSIDLDIIIYDNMPVEEPLLFVPHKEASYRACVLQPLCEVWPDSIVVFPSENSCFENKISARHALEWLADDPHILRIEESKPEFYTHSNSKSLKAIF